MKLKLKRAEGNAGMVLSAEQRLVWEVAVRVGNEIERKEKENWEKQGREKVQAEARSRNDVQHSANCIRLAFSFGLLGRSFLTLCSLAEALVPTWTFL